MTVKQKCSILLNSTLILVAFIFNSCADKVENESFSPEMISHIKEAQATSEENWNISFLFDLSDRINPEKYPNSTMEFYQRDTAYIHSVAKMYYAHLRSKKTSSWNDQIQIYFDPEPSDSNINTLSKKLKYSFTKENATIEYVNNFLFAYSSLPASIYESAIEDGRYVGSDTWGFFKSKVNSYCIENDHRNILVILTDGYIYHVNNRQIEGNRSSFLTPEEVKRKRLTDASWQAKFEEDDFGFIPASDELDNLEILVLNINPAQNSPYEEDVLRAYWTDWFEQMGVKRYEIQTTDLPSNTEKIIKDFFLYH